MAIPNLVLALSFIAGVSWGQTTGPSFEVATIHPSPALETVGRQIQQGSLHAGISIGPARVEIGFLSLADLIPVAYGVMPFQVSGPEWMKLSRWDVLAKMPQGASRSQVPEMLKALLMERFKLQVHKESKELSVYVLTLAKDGPALKAATAGGPTDSAASGRDVVSTAQGAVHQNPDGSMTVTGGSLGLVRVTMDDAHPDSMRLQMNITMPVLAELLSSMVDKPVVDKTGLAGDFTVSMELPSTEGKAVVRFGAGIGMLRDSAGASVEHSGEPAVFEAIKKLGLRLEARKTPVEMIVVDHVEKSPTAN